MQYRFSRSFQGLTRVLFPLGLPVTILNALLCSPILATCYAYFSLLDWITLTIIRFFLQQVLSSYSPFSCVFGQNIHRIYFLNYLPYFLSLIWESTFHCQTVQHISHYPTRAIIIIIRFNDNYIKIEL